MEKNTLESALKEFSQTSGTNANDVKEFFALMSDGSIKRMPKEDMATVLGGLIPVITDSVTLKGLTFNIHIFCKIVFIDIIGTSTGWIDQDIIFNNIPKTTYSHRIKLFREIKDCTISTRNYNNVIYANIPNNKSFGDSQNGYYQDLYVI